MKKIIMTLMMLVTLVDPAGAQTRLDNIRQMLEQAPVQEKVYLHLDNTCYWIMGSVPEVNPKVWTD